jgi:hypothetical protein
MYDFLEMCVGLADGESCLAGGCDGTPWTAECSNGTWLVKPGFCYDRCSSPNLDVPLIENGELHLQCVPCIEVL